MNTSCFLTLIFAAVILGAPAEMQSAEVMPDTLPSRVPVSTQLSAVAWTQVSEFLPSRPSKDNAVLQYAKAAELIRQSQSDQATQNAMSLAFQGALCERADFLSVYSYRSWQEKASPDLEGAMILSRALGRSTSEFLAKAEMPKALAAAQTMLSMGEHYRTGAPTLAQSLVGEAIIHQGLRSIRAVYARMGDKQKARLAAQRAAGLDRLGMVIEARSAAMAVAWQTPEVVFQALRDPEPVIRADTLLLIEGTFDPQGSEKLMQDAKIQPLVAMLKNEKARIQQAVMALLQDPNPMVKSLVERVVAGAGQ